MSSLHVAALTGGQDDPSSRFRVRQYIPALDSLGVVVRDYASVWGRCPPVARGRRVGWGCGRLAEAVWQACSSRRADVVLLQREMLSTLMTAEPLTRHPRVLDVDDAIWLHSRFGSIDAIARHCDAIICGNDFLADHFRGLVPHIYVVPTGVDVERWVRGVGVRGPELRIGWTGTSGNLRYLDAIVPSIREVLRAVPQARFVIMSDRPPDFQDLPADRVEYQRWSSVTEVAFVQSLTVGLMPLEDGAWERGKCAYKMLLYLASGVPVIVSPVGASAQVLAEAGNRIVGMAASSVSAWTDGIVALLRDPSLVRTLGANGRDLVSSTYSVAVLAPQLAEVLRGVR
jgi:glycosyltransferase involved in cell wall biosynthesis